MVPKQVSYRFPGIDYCIVSIQRGKVPIPTGTCWLVSQGPTRRPTKGELNMQLQQVKHESTIKSKQYKADKTIKQPAIKYTTIQNETQQPHCNTVDYNRIQDLVKESIPQFDSNKQKQQVIGHNKDIST